MKQDNILLKLGLQNEDGSLTQEAKEELNIFVQTYISALCENIDARFNKSLPLLSAFGIFDPLKIPKPSEAGFPDYGSEEIACLADHFYPENREKKTQLTVQYNKWKYELASMNIPECESPKCWALTRFLAQRNNTKYRESFSLLIDVAEVVMVTNMENSWPERGASCMRRVKTKIRSSLGQPVLNALMHMGINGPEIQDYDEVRVTIWPVLTTKNVFISLITASNWCKYFQMIPLTESFHMSNGSLL